NIYKNLAISTLIKNNELINEIPKALNIISDENIIEFILRNLISNASKFTANGSIKVSAHFISDSRLTILVTDTGTGMSEGVLSKLYNGGKNNSLPGTNNEKGSGVGLMLVRDFITKIGSELKIESKLGKGTTISFELEYQL
ncbi:MAG: sensor histidine kinase, partial [Chitinophagaceae bacterium]